MLATRPRPLGDKRRYGVGRWVHAVLLGSNTPHEATRDLNGQSLVTGDGRACLAQG